MDNVELALISFKNKKEVPNNKKKPAGTSSFKRLYQAVKNNAIKREKEEENKKRYRLSIIIHKLQAGIILTSDELQFLKNNAPMYYNKAMRQQQNYRAKNTDTHNISAIAPINII